MSWFSRNRHWLLLALVAVTTVLAVGTVVAGLLVVLAGLAGGAGLGAVLGDAALVLLLAALLVAADAAFAVAFLVTLVRRASLPSVPEHEGLATAFERAERLVPPLATLGLSEAFAVSTETKRERLKEQYVAGEVTQAEYERRLRELLAAEEDDVSDVAELDADLGAGADAADQPGTARSSVELDADAE